MAASGFTVPDESLAAFDNVKKRKSVYVVYKAADGKIVTDVEGTVEQKKTWDDLVTYLSETCAKLPRFCAVDFTYETKDQRQTSKVLFLYWSPESASVREKMVYSSSLEALKNKLQGVHPKNVQASGHADLNRHEIVSTLGLD